MLVGGGFEHRTVLDGMQLWELELAASSLPYRNLNIMQALRYQTAALLAPYSKGSIDPADLYPLEGDDEEERGATECKPLTREEYLKRVQRAEERMKNREE